MKNNSSNISSNDEIVEEVFLPHSEDATSEKDYSDTLTDFVVKKPRWNEGNNEEYQGETTKLLRELSETYTDIEFIPTLCKLFSRTLVISAENNIETINPSLDKTYPFFKRS